MEVVRSDARILTGGDVRMCWIFDCSSHAYIPMRAGSETQLLLSVTYHYSNIVPPLLAHTTSDYHSA